MAEGNKFHAEFLYVLKDTNLMADIQQLYIYEELNGEVGAAASILALIPDFGYVEKINTIHQRFSAIEIKNLREKLSTEMLKIITEIKPKEFSTWQEAQEFDQMLHLLDGSMLCEAKREEFLNLRGYVRGEWQARAHENSEFNQEVIIVGLEAEYQAQKLFRNQLTLAHKQQSENQTNALQRLQNISKEQKHTSSQLTQQGKSIQQGFASLGMQIDKQTIVLLQSDAGLSHQLKTVTTYLAIQEQRDVEAALAKEKQTNYDGLNSGFALLGAVGQLSQDPTLQKVAMIGSQSIQIYRAFDQLSELSGLAALNPYAAIGMAVLNIASLFMKKGPDPQQIIMKQLEQISRQIANLHETMNHQFSDVKNCLHHIERMIALNARQIQYLARPIHRRFDEIQVGIQFIVKQVHTGFQDVLLQGLKKQTLIVEQLEQEIIPKESFTDQQIMKRLSQLAEWLKCNAYNQHFTGMTLLGTSTDQLGWAVSAKQCLKILQGLRTPVEIIPVLQMYAQQKGWMDPNHGILPHTGLWYQALKSYLSLRKCYQDRLQKKYDRENKEFEMILRRAEDQLAASREIFSLPEMLLGTAAALKESLQALSTQYQQLQQLQSQHFQINSALGQAQQPLFPTVENAGSQAITVPQNFQFSYVPGKDNKKRRGRQREFTAANGFTQQQCLQLIVDHAATQGIALFDKQLLLAERAGLVEFHCKMHRTMGNGANQIFTTDGKRYGLDIILYIKDTQQRISLTSAKPGRAKWSSAHHKTTKVTIDSHKKALPHWTIVSQPNVQKAVSIVSKLLQKQLQEAREPFYQMVENELLKQNSLLYQAMLQIHLLRFYTFCNRYHFSNIDLSTIYTQLQNLEASFNNGVQINTQAVDSFFSGVAQLIEVLNAAQLSINPDLIRCIGNLDDVCHSLQAIHEFKEDTLPVVVAQAQQTVGKGNFSGLLANFGFSFGGKASQVQEEIRDIEMQDTAPQMKPLTP